MAKTRLSEFLDLWSVKERRLLYIYLGILFFIWAVDIIQAIVTNDWSLWTFGNNMLSGILFASFFVGFVFTRRFWNQGIVPARRIIIMLLKLSLIVGLFVVMIFSLILAYYPEEAFGEDEFDELSDVELIGMMIVMFFMGFLFGFVGLLFMMVVGMGFVGAVVMFEVGLTPVMIRRVRGITTSDDIEAGILAWFLLIPENLDTGTLSVTRPVKEDVFPKSRFYHAISWQIMISLIIALSLSLNPFVPETISPSQILNLLTNANIIVPLIILPALLYLRLRVRIEGPVKDFRVYKGIQSRLLRTFFAFGTIIIILRLAMEDVTSQDFLISFAGYAFISGGIIVFFTWLYYNFFEEYAAFKVIERVPGLVKGEVEDVKEGETDEVENGKVDVVEEGEVEDVEHSPAPPSEDDPSLNIDDDGDKGEP